MLPLELSVRLPKRRHKSPILARSIFSLANADVDDAPIYPTALVISTANFDVKAIGSPSRKPPITEVMGGHSKSYARSAEELTEDVVSGIIRDLVELLFDAEQLVIFRDSVRARQAAGLDLTRAGRDRQARDEGVRGLAGAV